MSDIAVVTDSTADLPAALLARYPIAMVPLVVNWDGQTFRDKLDLTTQDFYVRLRASKSLPKTGAPSIAAFEAEFRRQLEHHGAVVSVNVASRLSGTYDIARRAAQSEHQHCSCEVGCPTRTTASANEPSCIRRWSRLH